LSICNVFSACRVVGSAEVLIWSRRVFAEGASSCRGQGAVVQKGLVQMGARSKGAEGPRPMESWSRSAEGPRPMGAWSRTAEGPHPMGTWCTPLLL